MLRVKSMKEEAFYKNSRIDNRNKTTFYALLGGCMNPEEPPFRDKESLKIIEEIDKGKLVGDDWYSYRSPLGRTCMCHLSGGAQYALTCIANSRRGIYTAYKNCGKDIWERLGDLDMDILIAYNIWDYEFGVPELPYEFPPCIIENYLLEGKETEVLYDGRKSGEEIWLDEYGRFHVTWTAFDQYCYNWKENLPNILQSLRNRMKKELLWNPVPTEVSAKEFHELEDDWPCQEEEDGLPRKILLAMTECCARSSDKYPRILYIRHYHEGIYSFEEHCPVKYPNFEEIIDDVVKLYDSQREEAFAAVFDVGGFHKPEHFQRDIIWEFHDNGRELTCYSGELGLKKLVEFWEISMECKEEKRQEC